MTTAFDPANCERLCREAKRFADMDASSPPSCDCQEPHGDHEESCSRGRHWLALDAARFTLEQNARAMADQLEAAGRLVGHLARLAGQDHSGACSALRSTVPCDCPWGSGEPEHRAEKAEAERDRLQAGLEAARARITTLEAQPVHVFDKLGADRMADEIAVLVQRKVIGSRCPAADALLDYRDPPQSERSDRLVDPERGIDQLNQHNTRLTAELETARREVERLSGQETSPRYKTACEMISRCTLEVSNRASAAGWQGWSMQDRQELADAGQIGQCKDVAFDPWLDAYRAARDKAGQCCARFVFGDETHDPSCSHYKAGG